MALTNDERDELLIRLDERMKSLKDGDEGDVPDIKRQLTKVNSRVSSNTAWITAYKWVLGGIITALIAALSILLKR